MAVLGGNQVEHPCPAGALWSLAPPASWQPNVEHCVLKMRRNIHQSSADTCGRDRPKDAVLLRFLIDYHLGGDSYTSDGRLDEVVFKQGSFFYIRCRMPRKKNNPKTIRSRNCFLIKNGDGVLWGVRNYFVCLKVTPFIPSCHLSNRLFSRYFGDCLHLKCWRCFRLL